MSLLRRGKKVLGVLNEGVFRKTATAKQVYKKLGVPMVDALSWDAIKDDVDKIVIETEWGETYEANKADFERDKVAFKFGINGQQYTLPKDKWSIK